jgi:hypothetical protein
MEAHYLFKGIYQLVAGISPVTDLLQPQDRRASKLRRIKVLMSDGVSPEVQLLKPALPSLVARIQASHFSPKGKPKSIVVRSDVPRIGVSFVQLPVLNQNIQQRRLQNSGWDALHEIVRALRMQVTTVRLKLGRQQDGVCLIDLLGGMASSAACPTDAPVGSFQLIKSGLLLGPPNVLRSRRHRASRRELKTLILPSPASAIYSVSDDNSSLKAT